MVLALRLTAGIFFFFLLSKIDGAGLQAVPSNLDPNLKLVQIFPEIAKAIEGDQEANQEANGVKEKDELYFYFARHGETDWNAKGLLQGKTMDPPLNEEGEQQAAALAAFLEGVPLGLAASSTLWRARATAAAAAAAAAAAGRRPGGGEGAVAVRACAGFDELCFGELEGKCIVEEPYKSQLADLKASWEAGNVHDCARGPGAESPLAVRARATDAVRALAALGHRHTLVVGHWGCLRITIEALTGLKAETMPNAGVYVLEYNKKMDSFKVLHHDDRALQQILSSRLKGEGRLKNAIPKKSVSPFT